ncbi:methyltransferase GidB [Rippkaea orientalis PCC 8801]|uniref:Ribosomal RNA small subunit methyltransferase G n=1 Tax=Rippkaea orientalis (strain PCC 8801 / RF-1) TaxID=41431 RepID=B7JZ39_RIPO1|nr:16S rRNA (guanine(527)-N(7))-methyltransferase RsmG [Rippkaea orientalis]ACK66116.1 methyltransferase GidB [Rippkaea orientalis PCC 8801]
MLPKFSDIWQNTLNWNPNPSQQKQWDKLYHEIILANRQINLTRITEPNDFWEKHLWDSLAGILDIEIINLEQSLKVIDIGTGAGFPGIPIGIVCPNWQVTLFDSTRKKINFIKILLEELSLKNCHTLIGRAEEIGQNPSHRESYDLALIRAVGEASVCAEYTLPLLKTGGMAVLYRGNWTDEEELKLKSAIKQLGGKIALIRKLQTPLTQSIRHFIYLEKIAKTPLQFPRSIGVPNQYPL